MTVQELRNKGYKVKVLHFRNQVPRRKSPSITSSYLMIDSPKGGITKVIVDSPTGQHYEGEAKCSVKDNYNKKLGVKIAIGRCGLLP